MSMMVPPGECEGESWSHVDWSMSDGASGTTGCHGPVDNNAYIRSDGARRYWGEQVGLDPTTPDRLPPDPLPAEVCGAPPGWEFQNYPIVAGTTGPLAPDSYPMSGLALDPNFHLTLNGLAPGAARCSEGATQLQARAEGTFEILVGGTYGDEVEFVVRDARWDLPDGRVFTIDEGRWHFRLTPDPQIRD